MKAAPTGQVGMEVQMTLRTASDDRTSEGGPTSRRCFEFPETKACVLEHSYSQETPRHVVVVLTFPLPAN